MIVDAFVLLMFVCSSLQTYKRSRSLLLIVHVSSANHCWPFFEAHHQNILCEVMDLHLHFFF